MASEAQAVQGICRYCATSWNSGKSICSYTNFDGWQGCNVDPGGSWCIEWDYCYGN